MKKIAFVGYGLRAATMMQAFASIQADIEVCAIVDPRAEEVRACVCKDSRFFNTAYYQTMEEMLQVQQPDGVFIGTRCSLHTPLATTILGTQLPLFLEKPVCINEQQYTQLVQAAQGHMNDAVVSFPLRLCAITQEMKRIIDTGVLGKINMVQAINNVPYGSVYYHSWYRDEAETGGLFLQKATHDLDYILYLTDLVPTEVCAKTAKLHFKGTKPAGLSCQNCAEYRTCQESSFTVKHVLKEEVTGEMCCFASDTGNEDSASAVFSCKDGVLISYSQNFVVKKSAARRGARIIGTKGSLEFDFYTAEIRFDDYRLPQTAIHKFTFPAGAHFGGDDMLALEFMNLMEGKAPVSNLKAGLRSAACCLAARKSAQEHKYVAIEYGFSQTELV